MANAGYQRFGFVAAALMTLCISTPSYATAATSTNQTFATSDWPIGHVFIDMVYSTPAFAFDAPVAIKDYREVVSLRHPPMFEAMAIHQRRSLSAVRPSSIAGWRSGRVRRLASV